MMGVFLSVNGWSENVPQLLKQNSEKSILLMDGYDLRCAAGAWSRSARPASCKIGASELRVGTLAGGEVVFGGA